MSPIISNRNPGKMNNKHYRFVIDCYIDDRWKPIDAFLCRDFHHAIDRLEKWVMLCGGELAIYRVRSRVNSEGVALPFNVAWPSYYTGEKL